MSKFLICECCNQTYLEEDMSKNNKNMCCSCWCYTRPKDKRIAELEEQLKNTIPFKTGQTLYSINKRTNCIYELSFEKFMYKARRLKDGYVGNYLKEELFATEEEAQAKLKELQEK